MLGRFVCPTVGLTVSSRATEKQRSAYRRVLEQQGARVREILSSDSAAGVEALHGLLLSGGGDIHPSCYGRDLHPRTADIDTARDELELRLVREALAAGMPILGICRGAQVLGVALGGTLVQDIPSETPSPQKHSEGACHRVRVAKASRLWGILGCERPEVNSFHHQANDSPGDGARAVAWAEDDVVEAIEANGDGFVIGVQWHPERMCDRDEAQRRLFTAFLAAGAAYAAPG